jgi:hypothetical protein
MRTYHGHCHCGALRFSLVTDEITDGIRCNCSFCARKGAVMSTRYYTAPAELQALEGLESLACYRFGDAVVNHYFCRTCGIYTFHDVVGKPGQYRINLGCLDDFDPLALPITLIDGRSF